MRPAKKTFLERHSRPLAVVGGVLFTSAILLFLAWIQPVNSERDKIELPATYTVKLTPKAKKTPPRPPEKKQQKEPTKTEKPKRKQQRRPSPRKAPSKPVRRPTVNAPLRAFAGSSSLGAISLGVGTGGGGGLAIPQDFGADVQTQDEAAWDLFQARNEQVAQDRYVSERRDRKRVGGKASKAKITYAKEPNYPKKAKQDKVEGSVRLQILVGQDGRVEDFEVEHADPPGYFEEAIAGVLDDWVFTPAKDDEGRPIRDWTSVVYNFNLKEALR